MVKPKGNLYVYAGAALAGLAMISALIFGAIRYVNGVDTKAFERGQKAAEAAYTQRDNAALTAAREEVQRLTAKVRAQEAKTAKDMAALDKRRQKELSDAKAKHARDLAAVRDGLRLRDPGSRDGAASPAQGGGSAPGAAPGTSGVGNGAPGIQLSAEATRFLLELANEADEVALQLQAAQEVIRLYLETVNGRNQEVPRTP